MERAGLICCILSLDYRLFLKEIDQRWWWWWWLLVFFNLSLGSGHCLAQSRLLQEYRGCWNQIHWVCLLLAVLCQLLLGTLLVLSMEGILMPVL